jgi:glycosyltransferase involved in cell wall biosynthesis
VAPHYRGLIYNLLDQELACDFYFGDRILSEDQVKAMNVNELKGFKGYCTNFRISSLYYWQVGLLKLAFKPYDKYLLTGAYYCINLWLFLFITWLMRKKTYLWTHGYDGREKTLKKLLKRIFYGMTCGIFLYGEYAKRLMEDEGYSPLKLNVVYNSLDYDNQIEIRNKLKSSNIFHNKFKNSYPTILFIGRLTPEKRLDLLIEAIGLLCSRNKLFDLIIIGDGSERSKLVDQVMRTNLEDFVWFFGSSYDELTNAELIYNADICVSPGNVGLTSIHSLTYGTPIITHSNFEKQGPEFEAIENKKTGMFFEEGDAKDLALTIEAWFEKPVKDRNKIRTNSYKVIDSKYNPHFQVEIFKKVLL